MYRKISEYSVTSTYTHTQKKGGGGGRFYGDCFGNQNASTIRCFLFNGKISVNSRKLSVFFQGQNGKCSEIYENVFVKNQ